MSRLVSEVLARQQAGDELLAVDAGHGAPRHPERGPRLAGSPGCVPIDSDVNCVGGSGNGPSWTGYVQVIGNDIDDVDGDGDGDACE